MELCLLGTGGSWPTRERNVPAIALRYGGEILLFDCGEGTQRQFMHTDFSFMKITKIFITHFHGDHFLGLPGLIQSMALNDRTTPLEIYGPKGTIRVCRTLLKLGYFNPEFEIKIHDMKSGDQIQTENFRIRCIQVDHNGIPAFAYTFEEYERPGRFNRERAEALGIPPGPLYSRLQRGETIEYNGKVITPDMVLGKPRRGRKITYSGDTRYYKPLIEFAADSDVLIHDGTFETALASKAHAYGHSTASDAARIAKDSNAKFLILIHISPRYKSCETLERDAQQIFGNTIVGFDFFKYTLKVPDNEK